MEQAINFYELKTQLAEMGYSDPVLVDALRDNILDQDKPYFSIGYLECLGQAEFRAWFDYWRNPDGSFRLGSVEGTMQYDKRISQQLFSTGTGREEALSVLTKELQVHGIFPNTETVTNDKQINKQHHMNTQNLEFLKKTLLNLGFGEKLNGEMESQMTARAPEFKLQTGHEFNGKQVDYTLHFKAGENQEMYFFNKFDAAIKNGSDQRTDQSFYINKGSGITAKEAFNLIEGRAVHKQLYNQEGEKYNAWLKLDKENLTDGGNMKIRSWNENYGYKPEEVLTGKGIKEMDGGQSQDNLLRSLKKGNAQQITVSGEGGDKKYFITANPQFKTVDLFDHQMKKIKREELLKPDHANSKDQKKSVQQKEALPAKKQGKKAKQTV